MLCAPFLATNANANAIFTFYNEISSLIRYIPKHNVPIISGDMNAKTSKDVTNTFCLINSSNRNGEYLNDFSLENKLACFKKYTQIMQKHS